ncbi:MAG: DUF1848 family protein [Candidatus Geothermarchaeota archaeon]
MSTLETRLWKYNKDAKILKVFNPFRSRRCPLRLEVNVYVGCAYQCKYCYSRAYIRNFDKPRCKPNFEKNLAEDVKRALEMGLNELPVNISNSCDPFQPLENKYKHSLFAMKLLIENNFHLIVLTKNPSKLLKHEYLNALDPKKAFIEVTITKLNSWIFEPRAPSSLERIKAIADLIKLGFTVCVRIDPIIPCFKGVPGQTPSEINALIEKLYNVGVKVVIGKCLRLTSAIAAKYPDFYYSLKPYYVANGVWINNYYDLKDEIKRQLHAPIYRACSEYNMLYFTCLDKVSFPTAAACDGYEIISRSNDVIQ